jgi:hypothetical protein
MQAGHMVGFACALARRLLDNELQTIYNHRGQTEGNNEHRRKERKSDRMHLPFKCLREFCPRLG